MSKPLIKIDGIALEEGIKFDQVYYNGLRVLKRLQLTNLIDEPLLIKFEHNLIGDLVIQLKNENLPEFVTEDQICNERPLYYNEIFNLVEPIQELTLSSHEKKFIVLGYLPSIPPKNNLDPFLEDHIDNEGETYFVNTGEISLFAIKLKEEERGNYSILKVPFSCRSCQSILDSNLSNCDISFGTCAISGTYIRDFIISNQSEIPLDYNINLLGSAGNKFKHFFEFKIGEEEQLIDNLGRLNGFETQRLRMCFKPTIECEFNIDLQIVNINDPTNFIECHIYAIVGELDLDDTPLISTNANLIDFGDCYGGIWIHRNLTVKNLSDTNLEILLTSTEAEIQFGYTNEELNNNNNKSNKLIFKRQDSNSNLSDSMSDTQSLNLSKQHSPTSSKFNFDNLSINDTESNFESTEYSLKSKFINTIESDEIDLEFNEEIKYNNSNSNGNINNNSNNSNSRGNSNSNNISFIDELILKPGSEKIIKVFYKPNSTKSTLDYDAGKLTRASFQIQLIYFKLDNNNSSHITSPTLLKRKQKIKMINCKAKVCTSFIEVLPNILDFEDTNIGMHKSKPILIINHSDLPTQVELKYSSKVINCFKGPYLIPPNSSTEVFITLFPRKVNPDYRKQIVISNSNNLNNDQIVQIKSNHVDKNRVSFHSLFYTIKTATNLNSIDFKSVIVNSPKLANFTIANITNQRLSLELSTSRPEEIFLFKVNFNQFDSNSKDNKDNDSNDNISLSNDTKLNSNQLSSLSGADLRETILDKMDDQIRIQKKGIKNNSTTTSSNNNSNSNTINRNLNQLKNLDVRLHRSNSTSKATSYLDLADSLGFKSLLNNPLSNSTGDIQALNNNGANSKNMSPLISKLTLNNNLTNHINFFQRIEEEMAKPIPTFNSLNLEEEYAKKAIQQRKEFEALIKEQKIIPLKNISLEKGEQFHVIVVFVALKNTIPNLQGIPRTFNGKILIKLNEFDKSKVTNEYLPLLGPNQTIPVREMMVKALISKSIMELGQYNYNFELINKDDIKNKMIIIRNCSEVPLVFMLRKSGSIASGDLYFEGSKYGVIRGFGKKIVNLQFNPSLPGPFNEKIIIRNIFDPDNDQMISIKAMIRKLSNFSVTPLTLDFGACRVNELCIQPRDIFITNTHHIERLFEVRVDPSEMHFGWCYGEVYFYVNLDLADQAILTLDQEQQIEALEQKLKIALRKGNDDKVKKIELKLNKIRSGVKELPGMDENDNEEDESVLSSFENGFKSDPVTSNSNLTTTQSKDSNTKEKEKEPRHVVQRSAYSVVFPIPGNSRVSVSIYFKPLATQGLLEGIQNGLLTLHREMVSGQILVHEQRNRDACKRVIFSALVNYRRGW